MSDTTNRYIGKQQTPPQDGPSGQGCACILLFVLAMLFFCITSCSKVEYITETVHDTISTVKVDTFHHVTKERETLVFRDSVSHTEYVKGDTVFIKDWKFVFSDRKVKVNDSVYKSQIDSLKHIIDSSKEKKTVVDKPMNRLKDTFLVLAIIALSILSITLFIKR